MTASSSSMEMTIDSSNDNQDPSVVPAAAKTSWDLTCKISPYLDLHMMFPLLEFVDSCYASTTTEVAQARLALLRPTHMVDYAMDIYRELYQCEEVPQEMEQQKAQVYERLETLRNGCQPLIDLCTTEAERKKMMESRQWNLTGFANRGIPSDMVDKYREFAKFNYDCGDYQTARDMIQTYISFFALPPASTEQQQQQTKEQGSEESTDPSTTATIVVGNPKMYYLPSLSKHPSLLEALWGKLSCEILLENWEGATVALEAVRLGLEELAVTHTLSPLDALIQRTWLLHWSLFIFWKEPGTTATTTATLTSSTTKQPPNSAVTSSLEQMVDLFTSDKYLQAITTNAPHLLRYLTAAALLIKRRASSSGKGSSKRDNSKLNEVVSIMQHCEYTDPIVEFVDCLCLKFDFELAQKKLVQCQGLLENDFFLCHQTNRIMEEARVLVFENYCRIHHKVDLMTLSTKLALSPLQAERWIVDLIRTTSSLEDAKIDSEEGCVVMSGSSTSSTSVYEVIMERTRDFHLRSYTLMQNYQALLQDIRKEKARRQRAAIEDDYD